MTGLKHLLQIAERAAIDAGRAIMEIYLSGEFELEKKSDESPLTSADKRSHTIITEHLSKTNLPILSEEGGNRDFGERKNWKYFWLIDPLDGTREFIKKNGEFTVNVALIHGGAAVAGVIYAPCSDTLYSGGKESGVYKRTNKRSIVIQPLKERNQFRQILQKEDIRIAVSRSHLSSQTEDFLKQFQNPTIRLLGSSLKFIMLLENEVDIYPRIEQTMEWDTAAGHALLNASNRGVYQMDLRKEIAYNKPELVNPFFIAF